ncbi:4'-phosphopantetheinyl transferase superfamily protein [Streptomyces sp. NPDC048275]|uniref:4'-phosphopantetheinyl transferase family protein n=1 Tax=Streptomyces sp. NPDC048275 TaxID=3155629 RepID=UPI0033C35236
MISPFPPDADHRSATLDIPETWLLPAPDAVRTAVEAQFGLLDQEEQARAERFKRARDRGTYVVAHVGLRRLLGAHLGVSPAAVVLGRESCPRCGGPHGRPSVSASPPVHFSLSHAGDLALVSLARQPVGVDVEEARNIRASVDDIVPQFHPAERSLLVRMAREAREEALLSAWVRKEAYLKGLGIGLAADLADVHTGLGDPYGSPGLTPGWSLATVAVPQGYAAAVALRQAADPTTTLPDRVVPRVLDVAGA